MTITTNRTPEGYRRDVWNLAVKLAAAAGLIDLGVYYFLMETGRLIGRNPRGLEFIAEPGRVYLKADPETYYIHVVDPADVAPDTGTDGAAEYWYNQIMDRQERYLAD